MTPIETVEAFIDAWNRIDFDAVAEFFSEDVVYHNIPMEPVVGKAAARAFIDNMQADRIDWVTYHIAAAGPVVLTERLDQFDLANGKKISIPVMGTFEIENGKIKAWRDYFDLNTYVSQMSD